MKTLRIPCGDWIYPAKDSSSGVRYPIDAPVVAEIFLPSKDEGKKISSVSRISEHLRGPRFLEILLLEERNAIQIITLNNEHEELFHQGVGAEIRFDLDTLARVRSLPDGRNSDDAAIFFASVLLQAHLTGTTLPQGIVFRNAMMSEIESLGKW